MIHKISVPKPGTPENLLGIKFIVDLYPGDSKHEGLRPEVMGFDESGFFSKENSTRKTPTQFVIEKDKLLGKYAEIKLEFPCFTKGD